MDFDDLDREIDRELGIASDADGNRVWRAAKRMVRAVRTAVSWTVKGAWVVLGFPVIGTLRFGREFNASGAPLGTAPLKSRMVDALVMRAILAPATAVVFLLVLVWMTTHPRAVTAMQTPGSLGLYYRVAHVVNPEGQALHAWYIPPLKAEEVVLGGMEAVRQRHPAAILCHGLGLSHDQYLPLAYQLHEAGFAVLMLSVRGQGESETAAVTFGVRERADVLAALHYLQETPAVDTSRICLVGYGVGGTAVLRAAAVDPTVTAVVAEDVWPTGDGFLNNALDHTLVPGNVVGVLYKVAFEVAYRERFSELDLAPVVRRLGAPAVMFRLHRGPDLPALEEVTALAGAAPGRHKVVLEDATQSGPARREREVVEFLCQASGWEPTWRRLPGDVEALLGAKVK